MSRVGGLDGQVAFVAGRVLAAHGLAVRGDVVDLDGSRPDAWRHVVEAQDRGLPDGVTGCR